MDLVKEAKGIKTKGIVGLILLFTLVGAIVTLVLDIICGVKILTIDWKNKEVEDSKMIWGILCFILLGPISAIIFGSMTVKKLENGPAAPSNETEDSQEETL